MVSGIAVGTGASATEGFSGYTNEQIDKELCAFLEEDKKNGNAAAASASASAAAADFNNKCEKHDECLREKGHTGQCTWWDEDKRGSTFIPKWAQGWNITFDMDVEKKPLPQLNERVSRAQDKKPVAVAAVAPKSKAGKRKAEDPFAAALAAQEKAAKDAEAAERAAKRAKLAAEEKVAAAAKVKKEELRREATVKKREAAKMRLEAEKAARQAEREAEEMERMATNLSQTYGMLEILESFARVP